MTCIVGIVDRERKSVLIMGDSAGCSGGSMTIRCDSKVFAIGDFIFGGTTSFRMIQLLRYSFKPPVPDLEMTGFLVREPAGHDLDRFMCTRFVDRLRTCFQAGGFLTVGNGADIGGQFLVGYRDRLFRIDSDFQVGEAQDGFDSVGSGQEFARGAIHALRGVGERDKPLVARKALEAASHYSTTVRGPFRYVSTGDLDAGICVAE
jgi:hypothetical protein